MSAGRVLGGRYRIEELLGSGGMGAVWRGRDLRLDRAVAVKELTGAGMGIPMAVTRFDREARAVARLAHPNIVALHDVGAESEHPYLVMELIEGTSVAAMLNDGPLSLAAAVAIAAQTCDGLAAAHAAGIVHRDIKPANLLLTGTGVVKICDFGIARLHDAAEDADLTRMAPPVGSWKYMAPEQVTGGPVDERTDLYALGCTLHAMIAGAPPFTGDQVTVLHEHRTRPPAPLRTLRADVPPGLEALVQHLLRKNPDLRPADATEVRTRLAGLAQELAAGGAPAFPVRLAAVQPATDASSLRPARRADPSPVPGAASVVADPSTNAGPASPPWRFAAAGTALLLAMASIAFLGTRWWSAGDDIGAGVPAPAVAASIAAPPERASQRPEATVPTDEVIRRKEVVPQNAVVPPSPAAETPTTGAPRSPAPPVDPIVGMRLSIRQQADAGHLNPAKAPDLYKKVDEIARAINEGKSGAAEKKIGELRDKFVDLHDSGTLSTRGYDALVVDLDRLAASLS